MSTPKKGNAKERMGTIAVSLTNFLDSGCIVGSSLVMTMWAAAFGLDATWIAVLGAIGANAFGAAVGAIIGGFFADKYGRKFIYTYNLLLYAFGALICLLACNVWMVLIGTIALGISVGAGVPASWSYISEISGSNRRAHNIGISQFAWSVGPAIIFALGIILSYVCPATDDVSGALLPAGTYGPFDGLLAGRIIFAVLFVVALIAWTLQRQLEESKDWLEKNMKETTKEGKLVGQTVDRSASFVGMMKTALSNSVNVKTILFLVAVYLTWNLVAGTMGQFMPYMYSAAGIADSEINILQTVMWILTAVGSIAIFAALGDRIPHRVLYAITSIMAILAWAIMVFFGFQRMAGTADQWGWLLWVFVALWGVSAGFSAQCFYALWSTELFPTKYRGGVQGIMFFLVRGVLGLWSLFAVAGLQVGTEMGFVISGIIMVGFLAISFIVGVIGCPQTQGKSLDEITMERYGTLDL